MLKLKHSVLFKIDMKFQNRSDSDCCDILEFVCLSNCICHVDVTVLKATAHDPNFGQLCYQIYTKKHSVLLNEYP